MAGAFRFAVLTGAGLIAIGIACPALAQAPPPPVPAQGPPFGLPGAAPPFGLPGTAPPPFSKGKGLGPGKAGADVTFNCLGVGGSATDHGSPFSYVEDAVEISRGQSNVYLEGSASGDLAGGGFPNPAQGAAASIEAVGLVLLPFDVCDSSAGSVLASVVTGTHLGDPTTTGTADVEFHVAYQASLELDGSDGYFTAYTGTELEVLGLSLDSFEVTADGEVVNVPPGLSVADHSVGSHRVYEISGTYVIPAQLLYGPGVSNVVQTTFFAGGVAESQAVGAKVVAGFAAAEALDTISYEVVSLDPNVAFTFERVSDSGGEAAAQ